MAGRLAEKKKILEIIISVLLCLVFALSGVGCAKSVSGANGTAVTILRATRTETNSFPTS